MKRAYGSLVPIMKKAELSQKNKEILYNMLIRPIVLYGAIVWASSKPTSLEKIAVMERRIIRRITGLYKKENQHYVLNNILYNNTNINPMCKYLKTHIWAQKKRFWRHENYLIHQAARSVGKKGPYIRTKNINKRYLKMFFTEETLFFRG